MEPRGRLPRAGHGLECRPGPGAVLMGPAPGSSLEKWRSAALRLTGVPSEPREVGDPRTVSHPQHRNRRTRTRVLRLSFSSSCPTASEVLEANVSWAKSRRGLQDTGETRQLSLRLPGWGQCFFPGSGKAKKRRTQQHHVCMHTDTQTHTRTHAHVHTHTYMHAHKTGLGLRCTGTSDP